MSDPQPPAGETPAPSAPPAPETGADGQPFDAVRAQRTIDTLRDEIKASKAAAAELVKAKARLQEIEDKDKSETELLAARATEVSEKLAASEARARDLAIRLAVAETALTIGISGTSVKAAVRLLDHGSLEFDDDGTPTNTEAALKALVKEYPMLTAVELGEKTPKAASGTPASPKPTTNGTTSASEREQRDLDGLRATGRYSV